MRGADFTATFPFTLDPSVGSVGADQQSSQAGSTRPDERFGKESGRQQIRGGHIVLMKVIIYHMIAK